MKILFVCAANRDRSPALEKHFKEYLPQHEYKSAGVSQWRTSKFRTHYLTSEDINWSDLIVYAENVHIDIAIKKFGISIISSRLNIPLNLGEYRKDELNSDYILKAVNKVQATLLHMERKKESESLSCEKSCHLRIFYENNGMKCCKTWREN